MATEAGDELTLSYVLRHLCFGEQAAGRVKVARELLTGSTRLRRKLSFTPGVAANLIGLAYLAAGDGDREAARELLERRPGSRAGSGAYGVGRWIEAARDELGLA